MADHVVHATIGVDRVRISARFHASSLSCVVFVAAIATLARQGDDLAVAVYALSFWHYYLYWLAFRFGAVELHVLKRDAVLMKTVALSLAGWAYFLTPIDVASLAIVAAGFLLNIAGASALGSDRTYYGYEIADLPHRKITRFPYGWIPHPMLLGNVAAFGGSLINAAFRWDWWPLACAHMALNLGLLVMEVAAEPLCLGSRRVGPHPARNRFPRRDTDIGFTIASAALGAIFGFWAAWRTDWLLGAGIGACTCAYAYGMYRLYVPGQSSTAAGNQ